MVFVVLLLLSSVPRLGVHLEPVASDGLKTVLAALLGALSAGGARSALR